MAIDEEEFSRIYGLYCNYFDNPGSSYLRLQIAELEKEDQEMKLYQAQPRGDAAYLSDALKLSYDDEPQQFLFCNLWNVQFCQDNQLRLDPTLDAPFNPAVPDDAIHATGIWGETMPHIFSQPLQNDLSTYQTYCIDDIMGLPYILGSEDSNPSDFDERRIMPERPAELTSDYYHTKVKTSAVKRELEEVQDYHCKKQANHSRSIDVSVKREVETFRDIVDILSCFDINAERVVSAADLGDLVKARDRRPCRFASVPSDLGTARRRSCKSLERAIDKLVLHKQEQYPAHSCNCHGERQTDLLKVFKCRLNCTFTNTFPGSTACLFSAKSTSNQFVSRGRINSHPNLNTDYEETCRLSLPGQQGQCIVDAGRHSLQEFSTSSRNPASKPRSFLRRIFRLLNKRLRI